MLSFLPLVQTPTGVTEIPTSFLLKWVSGLHHSLSVSASMNPSQTIFVKVFIPVKCLLFFVCFKSNKAVSSPACSSLAILLVPAMVGSVVFHFRSLQSCRWNLLDHRAANATKEKFWLKEKCPVDFHISISGCPICSLVCAQKLLTENVMG